MRVAIVSHKICWRADGEAGRVWHTDGGFPYQVEAIAGLFDAADLLVPIGEGVAPEGCRPIDAPGLQVVELSRPAGRGAARKLLFPFWLLANLVRLLATVRRADCVHTPVPGDVGTAGIFAALLLRKRLFVRYCGNWWVRRTAAERFWHWLMERSDGDRRLVLATGSDPRPPSATSPSIRWIFATSLSDRELADLRRRAAGRWPGHRLVIVCRQERDKGTSVVLEALRLLEKELPRLHLDVVGQGGLLPVYRRQALELSLDSRVTFHGRVGHDEVLEILLAADLFCYPTRASEGFPKVVVEAMACGLPVIATPCSALPQLLAPGGGVLLETASAPALAAAVRSCLGDDSAYRIMSRRALDTAAELSLERWREEIRRFLTAHWGALRSEEA